MQPKFRAVLSYSYNGWGINQRNPYPQTHIAGYDHPEECKK